MEFYIPKTGKVTLAAPIALSTGSRKTTYSLVRGIHDIPDALADSTEAIAYGIKPVEEMTDGEWVSCGRKKPEPVQPKKIEDKTNTVVAKESDKV